jgi:hypothetical protein
MVLHRYEQIGGRATPVRVAQPPSGFGPDEPTYNAGTDTLVRFEDFNSYSTTTALRTAFGGSRNDQYISRVTGFSGSGAAARWSYGIGFGYDVLFGPDNFGASFTELFVTVTFRFSSGADPADHDFAGIKGFMFWDNNFGGGRYECACNRADNATNALATRFGKFFNLSNAASGLSVWKTGDGFALPMTAVNDGNSHRITFHMRAGAVSNRGAKYWVDGTLIYDDHGIDVVSGQPSGYEGYGYNVPIGGMQMFGNFPTEGVSESTPFTFDVDDLRIWHL